MQIDNLTMASVLTPSFVERWRDVYQQFYGYERRGEFLLVPSLSGNKTWCYLPGLTYSDRSVEEAYRLIDDVEGKDYSIRALDPQKKEFLPNEPVTMRVWINDKNNDAIVQGCHSTKRRNLRRADENNVISSIGFNETLIDDFYTLYTSTMHRLGTPPLSKQLFVRLGEMIETEIIVAYVDHVPAAGLLVVYDEHIAWNPYAASDRRFSDTFANEVAYRDAMFRAHEKRKAIFDCGRSPYGGGTYQFKKKMGAEAVGLAILRPSAQNLYAKYSRASELWKRLPKPVADMLGPKLRRFLADS